MSGTVRMAGVLEVYRPVSSLIKVPFTYSLYSSIILIRYSADKFLFKLSLINSHLPTTAASTTMGDNFSFRSSTTGAPLSALPTPDSADTLEWAKVQAARGKTCKLLTATAGQPIPPITQVIPYSDSNNNPAMATFKIESSPKWFTHVKTEFNEQGSLVITLGIIAGVKTATGRVARIVSRSGIGIPGASQNTEYYFQIS